MRLSKCRIREDTPPEFYGNIDIYMFDQLLQGRSGNVQKVLHVGCSNERNLHYFLPNGYQVSGIDPDAQAVRKVKELSTALAPQSLHSKFKISPLPGSN